MTATPTREEVISYVHEELEVGGASRDALLREAYKNSAPHSVILALYHLAPKHFRSADDLRHQLPKDPA